MSEYKFGTWYQTPDAPRSDLEYLAYDATHRWWSARSVRLYVAAFNPHTEQWFSCSGGYVITPTEVMPLPPPPSNGERKPEDPSTDDRLNQTNQQGEG